MERQKVAPHSKRHIRMRGYRVPVQSGESIPSAEVVEGVFLYIQHQFRIHHSL